MSINLKNLIQISYLSTAVLGLVCSATVLATPDALFPTGGPPLQLTQAQFTAQTANLPFIVATFDSFPTGVAVSPLRIVTGTYTGMPSILFGLWCINSNCLDASLQNGVFNNFEPGSTYWSARIIYASSGQLLRVTVVGNSGTNTFDLPPGMFVAGGTFFGFHDPAGLQSVTFTRQATGSAYSFDNVMTAGNRFLANGFEDASTP